MSFPFTLAELHNCVAKPSHKNPRGLTKPQLIAEAKSRGLATSGNKEELCIRIIKYEEGRKAIPIPAVVLASAPAPAPAPAVPSVLSLVPSQVRTHKKSYAMVAAAPPPPPPAASVPPRGFLLRRRPLAKVQQKQQKEQQKQQDQEPESVLLEPTVPFYRDRMIIKDLYEPQMEQGVELGRGTYGTVKLMKRQKDVVVKRYSEFGPDIVREISFMSVLNGLPSIVETYNYVPDSEPRLYLKGYASDLIRKIPFVTEDDFKRAAFNIALGIYYMHTRSIVHADLKPQNVLVKGADVAITDFGLSQFVMKSTHLLKFSPSNIIQTMWYRAPEVCVAQNARQPIYDDVIDVWSIACIMVVMITGRPLLPGDDDFEELDLITSYIGPIPDVPPYSTAPIFSGVWKSLKDKKIRETLKSKPDKFFAAAEMPDWSKNSDLLDLLVSMLEIDPAKRLDMVDVVNHKYFNSVRGKRIFPRLNQVQKLRLVTRPQPGPIPADSSLFTTVYNIVKGMGASPRVKEATIDLVIRALASAKIPATTTAMSLQRNAYTFMSNFFSGTILDPPAQDLQELLFDVVGFNAVIPTVVDYISAICATTGLTEAQGTEAYELIKKARDKEPTNKIFYDTEYLDQAVTAIKAVTGTIYGPAKHFSADFFSKISPRGQAA